MQQLKRKIIRQGHNTLTITLPRDWCEQQKINGGDEVGLSIFEDVIHINANLKPFEQKVYNDISNFDKCSMIYLIRNLYRIGYDEIELRYTKHTVYNYIDQKDIEISTVIRQEVNNLVGFEIIEHSSNRILIKDISLANHENFDNVLRRIFYMIKECCNELEEGIKSKNERQIQSLNEKHDIITKFVSYCLRLLNKTDTTPGRKREILYHIISSLDKIADGFKHISRNLEEKQQGKNILPYLTKVQKSIEIYSKFFYKYSANDTTAINELRMQFRKEMWQNIQSMKSYEIISIQEMALILEIISDITVARMGLDVE